MKNKKGAIELSMTTIIVIVIGVTLLILGLAFVRNTFGNISKISKDTFAKASSMLVDLENINQLLTITPSLIELESKKDDVAKVVVLNQQEEDIEVKLTVTPAQEGIECIFGDTFKTTSEVYKVSSGKTNSVDLFIKDKLGNLRMTACNVEVTGTGIPSGEDTTGTLGIRIVQEKKLFG